MRIVLNILWLLVAGLWLAIGYVVAAIICFVFIITIPFGIAALRIAAHTLWPFGATVVRNPYAGAASTIGNVLWLLLGGWWLALAHIVAGIVLCVTIIGIPLGLACFKLVPVSFWPLGTEIVRVEDARALGSRPGF